MKEYCRTIRPLLSAPVGRPAAGVPQRPPRPPIGLLLWVVPLLILSNCAPGGSPPDGTFTLMSYNVQNLFDLHFDGTEYPEYHLSVNWNHETQARKLANIASAIAAARPDIVALQEVENARAATRLQASLRLRGCRYPALAVGDGPRRTVVCPAVLSRFPVVRSRGHAVVVPDGSRSRNILEADIAIGGDTLKLFVCHWPSKHHPESWRIAAARTLAARLSAVPRGADYLIVGDLNAAYDECETMAATGHDDTDGATGINHVLGTVESAPNAFVDYVTVSELAAGGAGPRHADLWLELPAERRWCYRFRGRPDTPDHVLVPPALVDENGISYVSGSFRVFRWNGRLLWNGDPYRWRIRRTRKGPRHEGRGYSDHLPLLVTLRLGPCQPMRSVRLDPPARPLPGTIGFESSAEGWLVWHGRARLRRDSAVARSGRYSLHVEAKPRRNATVARTLLVPGRYGLVAGRRLSLALRGQGPYLLRTRRAQAPWRYWCWNGKAFAEQRRPRYGSVEIDDWRTVVLDVGPPSHAPLELELRAGKDGPVEVWVDDVRIVGEGRR